MDIQRLRNLTTGILHTEMQHVYEDIGRLLNTDNMMTHELPNAIEALRPWLRREIKDVRFWNSAHDLSHVGSIILRTPSFNEINEAINGDRNNGIN